MHIWSLTQVVYSDTSSIQSYSILLILYLLILQRKIMIPLSVILKIKLAVTCDLLSFVPYTQKSSQNVRHYYSSLVMYWRCDMVLLASTREKEWTYVKRSRTKWGSITSLWPAITLSKQWTVIFAPVSQKWKYLLASKLLYKTEIYS